MGLFKKNVYFCVFEMGKYESASESEDNDDVETYKSSVRKSKRQRDTKRDRRERLASRRGSQIPMPTVAQALAVTSIGVASVALYKVMQN
jgi:hypothetical protein